MGRRGSIVVGLVLAVLVTALVDAQTPVSQAYRLVWEIDAPNLAEAQGYEYRAVGGDPAGILLTEIQCARSIPGAFECSAAFPAFVPGVEHAVRVTASNAAGASLPSNEIRFVFLIVPGQPRNLRPVRP